MTVRRPSTSRLSSRRVSARFDEVMDRYPWQLRVRLPAATAFTGASGYYLPFIHDAANNSATFTVVVGFKTTDSTSNMVGRWDAITPGNRCWIIDTAGASGATRLLVSNTTPANFTVTGNATADGAWHLAVGTVDSGQVATLYVDGVSVGTPATVTGTVQNSSAISTPIFICNRDYSNTGNYVGSFAEYAYSTGVMTAPDVAELWRSWEKAGT